MLRRVSGDVVFGITQIDQLIDYGNFLELLRFFPDLVRMFRLLLFRMRLLCDGYSASCSKEDA